MERNDLEHRFDRLLVGVQAIQVALHAGAEDAQLIAEVRVRVGIIESQVFTLSKIVRDGNGEPPLIKVVGGLVKDIEKIAADIKEIEPEVKKITLLAKDISGALTEIAELKREFDQRSSDDLNYRRNMRIAIVSAVVGGALGFIAAVVAALIAIFIK